MRTSSSFRRQQPVNMAGVGFRRWAQTLSKGKGPGITAMLSGSRSVSSDLKNIANGPYPKTPEERAAAAKKYNLSVEDYEPFPDNGEGYGDYPKLPERSQHERDPWYQWDHPDLRRNWGEPIPWDFDMYTRNRVDTSPTPLSWSSMCKQLFGFIGFMLLMFYLGEKFPAYQPVSPKQYPYNDLYLERGGDPEKEPEEVKHYEI